MSSTGPHGDAAFLWHSTAFPGALLLALSVSRCPGPRPGPPSLPCSWVTSSDRRAPPSRWLTPKALSSLSPSCISSCLPGSPPTSHTGDSKSVCPESNLSPPSVLSVPRFNPSPCLLHPHSGSVLTVLPRLRLLSCSPSFHSNNPHPSEPSTAFLLDAFFQSVPISCTRRMGLG